MAAPGYSPGQVLLITDASQWLTDTAAWKTAELGRASNTTVSADPDLQLTVQPGAYYKVKAIIRYNGASGNNMKWDFAAPSGSAFEYSHWNYFSSATVSPNTVSMGTTQTAWCDGTTNRLTFTVRGDLITGSTGGTFAFEWAQGTSSVTNTVVSLYSHLLLRRIG